MPQVKEAMDSETLRRVAIKIINLRQMRKQRNAEETLRRELSIHRKLKVTSSLCASSMRLSTQPHEHERPPGALPTG